MTLEKSNCFILTLDGPSGSGKGTIGQMIAKHYGWHYLDSGGLYRAFAYAGWQKGIDADDHRALKQLINHIQIRFIPSDDGGCDIQINGDDVTAQVRDEQAGRRASNYARKPHVRELLFDLQKAFALAPGLVADGRDMGSIVFAQANLKYFLTATAQCRAQRRYKQLKLKGFDVNLTRLIEDINQRDEQDRLRQHSPLVPAADAIILDTTELGIEHVYDTIVAHIDDSLSGAVD